MGEGGDERERKELGEEKWWTKIKRSSVGWSVGWQYGGGPEEDTEEVHVFENHSRLFSLHITHTLGVVPLLYTLLPCFPVFVF